MPVRDGGARVPAQVADGNAETQAEGKPRRLGQLTSHLPGDALTAGAEKQWSLSRGTAGRGQRLPRWVLAVSAIVFVVSATVLVAVQVRSFGQQLWMLDLRIYRWAGLVVRQGGDLYGARFPHYRLRFTYPPMAALIFAALSVISMSVLKWLVTAVSIASLAATLWLTWGARGYRHSARTAATLAAAGVALWLQPVQQTLGFGQVSLMLMLIIVADLLRPDVSWLKGAGVGVAAGVKLTPLIFIAYLLLTRRFRAAGVAVATFALTIAGSLLLLPAQARRYWLGGLALDSGRTGNNAYVANQSLHGALARILGGVAAAQPWWLAASVVVGVTGLLVATVASRRGDEIAGILTCALTGLLISPVSWSHHWVWMAPALVVAVDMAIGGRASATRQAPAGRRLEQPASWRTRPGWWQQCAAWTGIAVLAAPFFLLPEVLVPASVVQGTGASAADVSIGDLYVIAGLVILGVGFALIPQTVRQARSAPVRSGGPYPS